MLLRFGGIGRLALFTWLLLASLGTARAQAPGWSGLALPLSSPTGMTFITASALDANGNIYLLGMTQNTVTFGSTTFNLPYRDTFVAKWNPTSGFVWAVRCGGAAGSSDRNNSLIRPSSLAVQGNAIYIGGDYLDATAAFGPTILLNGVPSSNTANTFVAKLTDAGTSASFTWATRLSYDPQIACSLDALGVSGGSVYAAGSFSGTTLAVGGITITNANSPGVGADIYLAKLTDIGASGSVTWAKQAGGLRADQATTLAVRGNQVYLAGNTNSPTITFGSVNVPGIGTFATNAFVARLTDSGPTGIFDWAARAGSPSSTFSIIEPKALALSGNNIYLAGSYAGDATFGLSTLPTIPTTGANLNDIFVAKLTDAGSSGSFQWGLAAGSANFDFVRGLAANGRSVYVGGRFAGPAATFGSTVLTNPSQPSTLASAVYVARLTDAGTSGAWAWAQQGGGIGGNATYCYDDAASVLLGTGRGYLVGALMNSGNTVTPISTTATFGSQVQTGPGRFHPFIATWTDNTLLAAAPAKSAAPLSLWPNPAHGTATVRLPAGAEVGPLLLLDGLGRVVRRFPAPASGATEALLDLRGLPAGQYVLRGAGRAQRLSVE